MQRIQVDRLAILHTDVSFKRFLGAFLLTGATLFSQASVAQSDDFAAAVHRAGADRLDRVSYSGTGTWYRFGQAPVALEGWARHDVNRYMITMDFSAAGAERVQMDRVEAVPGRKRPPLVQSVDEFGNGPYAWKMAPGAKKGMPLIAQPQPEEAIDRMIELWASPLGFLKAASGSGAKVTKVADGFKVMFSRQGLRFDGLVNARGDVTTVNTRRADPVLGDMEISFVYNDYREQAGIRFPGRMTRSQGGFPIWDFNVDAAVSAEPEPGMTIPDNVRAFKAPADRVDILQVADGVYVLGGANYNTVAIEQSKQVVVVEAPRDEARSLDVLAKIATLIPGKPVRYVIATHGHFDHVGGLRTYVARGATVIAGKANKRFFDTVLKGKRTLEPDLLTRKPVAARIETVIASRTLDDPLRPVEIQTILGSGHTEGFLMVYLPKQEFLIEADAFNMPPPGSRAPAQPNPYTVNLFDNLARLNKPVRLLIPLHGAIGHMSDLRRAIGRDTISDKPAGCREEAFYC